MITPLEMARKAEAQKKEKDKENRERRRKSKYDKSRILTQVTHFKKILNFLHFLSSVEKARGFHAIINHDSVSATLENINVHHHSECSFEFL